MFRTFMDTADTANVQGGGQSFLDDVGDALNYGSRAAVASGIASIYNTGVSVANFFGADKEKWDVAKSLTDVDQNWGRYYTDHKDVIDTVGFIGTSFIPGGLAVKGLNLARRGEAFGAFGKALNYTSVQQSARLESALQSISSVEGSVFSRLNKDFLGSLAWGAADNVIQTAAFEIGVAATMNASPLLEGQSMKDIVYDIGKNALIGGALGGGIEALFTNKIMKDAVKFIDTKGDKYSFRAPKAVEKLNLGSEDKAFSYIDAALDIPEAVFKDDKLLDFVYTLNGKKTTTTLRTEKQFDAKITASTRSAYLEFERHITTGLAEDTTVGKPFAEALIKLRKEGVDKGFGGDSIRQRMSEMLFDLKAVKGIGDDITNLEDSTIHYFNPGIKGTDLATSFGRVFTRGEGINSTRIRVKGDVGDLQIGLIGKDFVTTTDAFKAGMDVIVKPDGTWVLNGRSKLVRAAPERDTVPMFYNTKTNSTATRAVPTMADIATADLPLQILKDGVMGGGRTFKFSTTAMVESGDQVEQTARHLWLSSLQKMEGTVNANDFGALDFMSMNKLKVADDTHVTIPGIEGAENWKDLGNFDQFVFGNKVEYLRKKFTDNPKGNLDIQKVALEINAEPKWVQDVIESKFETNLRQLKEAAPDLTVGWQRDLTEYARRENLRLEYKRSPGIMMDDYGDRFNTSMTVPMITGDRGAVLLSDGSQFVTGMQNYHYRVKLAKDNLDVAGTAALGAEDFAKFPDITEQGITALANRTGTGAGLASSANAGYGDKLGLAMQESGKQVDLLSRKLVNSVVDRLRPLMLEIKNDKAASSELIAIRSMVQSSSEKFVLLGTEHGMDGTYIVNKALLKDGVTPEVIAQIRDGARNSSKDSFIVNSELTTQFLKDHIQINGEAIGKRKLLMQSQGVTSNIDPDVLYFPPIDTRRVPYHAFVVENEGRVGSGSETRMITASSPEQLMQLAGNIGKDHQVIFKSDTERYFKAKGDYDYSRALNQSAINSDLQRTGKLGDFMPSFKPEDVLEDFLQYHQRQQTQLVRDAVSTKYAQEFAELSRLSNQYTAAATSKTEPLSKFFGRTLSDPYDDYIKTALNISKRSEFTILHQLNEFVDAAGTRAYNMMPDILAKAKSGGTTWEEANQQMERFGLKGPYADQRAFDIAQTAGDRNLIRLGVQKANALLSTFTLRLDWANSLVNTISTPIMLGTELSSIRRSIANDPELSGKLAELTSLAVPGTGDRIPSTTKLIFNAMRNFMGSEKKVLIERYKANGDIKDIASTFHDMIDDLSLTPKMLPGKLSENADKWLDKADKVFGGQLAETFTRFVSADVMRQISDPLVQAGKMSIKEQNAYISTFVNRVQGNYISSQRPILFQGTLGSAVGLFQTYQFNLLQQLFRHIENKDLKTVATMGALQSSIFGLNGLPMFDAINTHIVGNSGLNPGHKDAYSLAAKALPKEFGDWLMYGTASALPIFGGNGPSLYTRGDVNPRHISIIPVTPMDVPAVDGTIRFVSNLINTAKKLSNGGDMVGSMLEGLEHNSVSRPLAGLAQALDGASTTSKGGLISSTRPTGAALDFFSISNASRIFGAKPLDESIALNTRYRQMGYQANDRDKIEVLGAAMKTKFRGDTPISEDDFHQFAGRYMAAGGNMQTFSSSVQSWAKDANVSVLNSFGAHMKTNYGKRYTEVMGGTSLDNMPSAQPQTQEPQQ